MSVEINLSEKELGKINSKEGLRGLLSGQEINVKKALRHQRYEARLDKLQEELLIMQKWVATQGKKVVILFEGRDAAGKGGAIRRIKEHLPPRECRVVALPQPDEVEEGRWYFQRYVNQLPQRGEIVFFDRSWYNRAVVEPVNGFCTKKQYNVFMDQVNEMEKMMIQSDIILLKLYFSITKREQEKRFNEIKNDPLKKWKFSPVDQKALEKWDEYTYYKDKMFENASKTAPWKIIKANRKTTARVRALEYILSKIPYTHKNKDLIKHKSLEK